MTSPNAEGQLLTPVAAGWSDAGLCDDQAVVTAMLRAESAIVSALVETGLAPATTLAAVTAAGQPAGPADVAGLARGSVPGGNPVIPLVQQLRARVTQVDPDAARWVHHGLTSQDVLDTALMLVARDVLGSTYADLLHAGDAAAALAREHRDTAAVGRTLTQQAMPTTFGAVAAGWLAAVADAARRVSATASTLPVQLGGPVGVTASYGEAGPEVQAAFAATLGLAAPVAPWHTRRTPVLDVAHAVTVTTSAVGTIAADVCLRTQTEIGELTEGSPGGSSSMPHKANPTRSVLVVAAARQVAGLASILAASAVAEGERPAGAWHAEWEPLRQCLRLAGAAAAHTAVLVQQLHVDTEAMARHADELAERIGDPTAMTSARRSAQPWIERSLASWAELAR